MMKKQVHLKVEIKTDLRPHKAKENDIWDEQLLAPHIDIDQSLDSLTEIDSELQHLISEVQEWEAGLLDDLGGEWS